MFEDHHFGFSLTPLEGALFRGNVISFQKKDFMAGFGDNLFHMHAVFFGRLLFIGKLLIDL